MITTAGNRMRRAGGVLLAGALIAGLAACSGGGTAADPAASAGPEGTDDGSELTLWTRAPLEKQANLLVDAYNASHEN